MKVLGKGSVASFVTILLNIAWYAIGLGIAVGLFVLSLAIVRPSLDLRNAELGVPVSFSVDPQTLRITAPSLGIENAQIEDVRGTLKFSPQNRASIIMPLVGVVLMLALVQWAIGQLRGVFRTLSAGQPFVPANATRIRRIALAVILGEIARSAAFFSSNLFVMRNFSAGGLHFDARPDLNLFVMVNGVIILVIAEVFRIGTRLDEDQSLTI